MRSATLHQSSPTANPKVTLVVGADTHTSEGAGGNERIIRVYTDEQVWGGQYIIELDNSDEVLNAKDYKGSEVDLNFSFIGETADSLPPLWVHNQQSISREGKLLLQLNCIDAWGLLSQINRCLVGAYYNQEWQQEANLKEMVLPSKKPLPRSLIDAIKVNYGKTIYTIIEELINTIGKTVVKAVGDDDGIIATYKPPINIPNALSGVRSLLDMTKVYLLWRREAGVGKFRVIKPDAHSTTYSYNTLNLFFSNLEDIAVVIPNRVTFWSLNETGTDWIHGTPAINTPSHNKLKTYIDRHYQLGSMNVDGRASDTTLTALATGALAKIEGERSQGTLVAPMQVTQELFDKIEVIDTRYTTPRTTIGYVHRIVREYDRGVYRITLQLGGATSGYTPPGGDEVEGLAGAGLPEAPVVSPDVDWSKILPKAIQGYQHNITFTAVDWDTVSWSSATIKFYGGTTQSILAGNTGDIPDDDIRYIYFDLADANPNVLKITTSYQSVMTEKTGLVCLVQRGSNTGIKATFIPSYGKEPLITPDFIDMTGIKAYTYSDGTQIQGIFGTQIQAGHIRLSAETYFASGYDPTGKEIIVHRGTSAPSDKTKLWFDTATETMKRWDGSAWVTMKGEWYNKSGVLVDATKGIRLYGKDMAFGTLANESDARAGTNYQTKMGSNGKIYAGAGKVSLDANGLLVKDGLLRLQDGTTYIGRIGGWDTAQIGLSVEATTGKWVRLLAPAGIRLYSSSGNILLDANDIILDGIRVDMSACDYLDIPRRDSAPSSYGGRHYYNPSADRCYNYYAGAWHTY